MSAEQTQADLRERAEWLRAQTHGRSSVILRADHLSALANRLDALAGSLPLRDTEQAVLDAAEKWREARSDRSAAAVSGAYAYAYAHRCADLDKAIDALRAARTGEGQ